MSNPNRNHSNQNSTQAQDGKEGIGAAAMSFATSTPAGFQAIATAYGDYRKRSFEDTRAFVEKLSGVKSFEKAIEIQTEFARTAFETFVSESQKIGELYGDLAKQSYKPFGNIIARTPATSR